MKKQNVYIYIYISVSYRLESTNWVHREPEGSLGIPPRDPGGSQEAFTRPILSNLSQVWPCLGFPGQVGTESVPTDHFLLGFSMRKPMRMPYGRFSFGQWPKMGRPKNLKICGNLTKKSQSSAELMALQRTSRPSKKIEQQGG